MVEHANIRSVKPAIPQNHGCFIRQIAITAHDLRPLDPDFTLFPSGKHVRALLQIDNLASRYVAADHGRRWMFEHYLVQTFMVLLIGSTLLRAPGFVRRVRRELAQEPGK